MDLYLVSQDVNDDWDTYDSMIVVAASEDDARSIHPNGNWGGSFGGGWCSSPEQAKVKWIGIPRGDMKRGVVLASFNAG
jgi:hypothetical protein